METVEYKKAEDRVPPGALPAAGSQIDLSPLVGRWVNTDIGSRGTTEVWLRASGQTLHVRCFGAAEPSPHDWGEVEAIAVLTSSFASAQATAFTALYRFDFAQSRLLANVSQGLLIVACFTSFHDDSGRANCFSREFFRRAGERGGGA